MKRKVIWLMVAVSLTVAIGYPANPPAVQWERRFPQEPVVDTAVFWVTQTHDNGYVLLGEVIHRPSFKTPILLLKMDSLGNTRWARSFGDDIGEDTIVYSYEPATLTQTSDNGYLIVCSPFHTLIIKTDSLGNMEWHTIPIQEKFVRVFDVYQTADQWYIISGMTMRDQKSTVPYLVKLSPSGDSVWARTYPEYIDPNLVMKGWRLRPTRDGGYILLGSSLLKVDSLGNQQWRKRYRGTDLLLSGQQTKDGGFILSGAGSLTYPDDADLYNMLLIKTDSIGNIQWYREFTKGAGSESHGASVLQTQDGGYLVGGMYCPPEDDRAYGYLVRTDSLGNVIWTKSFERRSAVYQCAQTSDGGYILLVSHNIVKLAPEQR